MGVPASYQHSTTPGHREYHRRYAQFNPWKWVYEDVSESNNLGSSLHHVYRAASQFSNKVDPTDYTVVGIRASGSYSRDYYYSYYYDSIKEDYDWASMANCIYPYAGAEISAPLGFSGSELSSQNPFSKSAVGAFFTEPMSSELNRLDNMLLAKLENNSAEIGAFLVELGETVSYVAAHALTLGNFAKCVVTGRWSKAARTVGISRKLWKKRNKRIDQTVAARWLEWNFAVKPLIGDFAKFTALHSSPMQALKALSFVSTVKTPIKGVAKTWLRTNTTTFRRIVDSEWTGNAHLKVRWRVADHETVALKALGLNAAAPALWEGVPFSWLLDYVVNVGDFLAGLSATDGLIFTNGYKSIKVTQTDTWSYKTTKSYPADTNIWQGSSHLDGFKRITLHSFPKPHLAFVLDEISLRQVSYVASLMSVLTNFKRRL